MVDSQSPRDIQSVHRHRRNSAAASSPTGMSMGPVTDRVGSSSGFVLPRGGVQSARRGNPRSTRRLALCQAEAARAAAAAVAETAVAGFDTKPRHERHINADYQSREGLPGAALS